MRLLFLTVVIALNCVTAKNNVKALTESMGHEIIEIHNPIKGLGLPPDLEEEPSAEMEEDEKVVTSTTLAAATKKDTKKVSSTTTDRRKIKDLNKIDDDSKQDDEEARIEKELAEIYKDNIDYKADSSEAAKEVTSSNDIEDVAKPIGRSRGKEFQFQPDLNNKAEVERFRTSVDEISCDRRSKLSYGPTSTPKGNSAVSIAADNFVNAILISTILSCRAL